MTLPNAAGRRFARIARRRPAGRVPGRRRRERDPMTARLPAAGRMPFKIDGWGPVTGDQTAPCRGSRGVPAIIRLQRQLRLAVKIGKDRERLK